MPIYEYRCCHCGGDFEALIWSAGEEDTVQCPKCESRNVERLLSASAKSCGCAGSASSRSGSASGGFR